MDRYDEFHGILVEPQDNGVLILTLNRPDQYNATNQTLHRELGQIWLVAADDPAVKAIVVTGAGRAFSAGGDLDDVVEPQIANIEMVLRIQREAAAIVYNIMNCPVPIVSAINGVAVGAGLAVALMADISVMAEDARFTDGHIRLGVSAGDHAAIIWPLLCGMAKAKYYLLTSDFIDGREAERIGLVSKAVPAGELLATAIGIADRLAAASQVALRGTKRALNGWLKMASPIFEASLAQEMLDFFHPDVRAGLAAIRTKEPARFPSAAGGRA